MENANKVIEYFEFLARKGLCPEEAQNTVQKWSSSQIADFFEANDAHSPYVAPEVDNSSLFDFIATQSLGGGRFPCWGLSCRRKKVDQLARFAVLYADSVAVPFPFRNAPEEHWDAESTRQDILDDLVLVYQLRPLLEAGLIGFYPIYDAIAVCAHHKHELEEIRNRLKHAARIAIKPYLEEIKVVVNRNGNQTYIDYEGPEKIIEHRKARLTVDAKYGQLIKKTKVDHLLEYLGPILDDIFLQNRLRRVSCLTNRELDLELIRNLHQSPENEASRHLFDGLTHSLPFVQQISLENLLTLREKEGESFQVYRDSLSNALKTYSLSNAGQSRQLFQDIIQPELNRIDLTVKNSRKLLNQKTSIDLLIGAGFLTVGLSNGLFSPTAREMLAAIGGYEFVKTTMAELTEIARDPISVRDNNFYFLWKVRKKSKHGSWF
jgi:hypothetical protein